MKQLLEVHVHASDSGEIPEIEQETLTNITKMLGATFIDDNHLGHKFKIPGNIFTDFLKSVEPQAAK
jgi:hypothetical protein